MKTTHWNFIFLALILGILETLSADSSAFASDWSKVHYLPRSQLKMTPADSPRPLYQKIFQTVDQTRLQIALKEMTGTLPVTIHGSTYLITDRYSPLSKKNFRAYWLQYFESLGIPAQELSYPTQHSIGEPQGHNLEAVLPGQSKDSIVIIVHYDSIGPEGHESENPGVDDDMTGMAIMLETAKILVQYKGHLQKTVRFVAADYEEHANPGLEGARSYASYLKNISQKENFKIIAAIDNEQSGWSCAADNRCSEGKSGQPADTFDVFSCAGEYEDFDFRPLGDALEKIALTYSQMKVQRGCMAENSDHYAMWEIGVPAVVFSEHNPFNNPHFDQNGGDTYDKIHQDYFFKIAQIGITFAASLIGIEE